MSYFASGMLLLFCAATVSSVSGCTIEICLYVKRYHDFHTDGQHRFVGEIAMFSLFASALFPRFVRDCIVRQAYEQLAFSFF